jgi:AcrR family transcriptional regulator
MSAAERRHSIVEAAVKLFSERGFRGTTTRELAAAVGVTEPVLYEHFKTKRDLYNAIIDAKSQETLAWLVQASAEHLAAENDRGFFVQLGREVVAWHVENPAYTRLLLFSALEDHELKQVFFERMRCELLQIVASHIRQRQEQGAMRGVRPDLAAKAFLAMFVHLGSNLVLFPELKNEFDGEEMTATMVDLFLRGIWTNHEERS